MVTLLAAEGVFAAGGQGHGHDGHWMAPPEAARRANPVRADAASVARGRRIFEASCVSCHGVRGKGDGPAAAGLPARPADLALMAPQHSDGDLAWKIAEGRGPMPSWKRTLGASEIWDVVNYLKTGLGGSGGPLERKR
jgi:mono/diheme cytochrome c family protein